MWSFVASNVVWPKCENAVALPDVRVITETSVTHRFLRSNRAARIAFGFALLVSVPRIVLTAVDHPWGNQAAVALGQTWALAAIVALAAWLLAPRFPHVRISVVQSVVIPSMGVVFVLPITLHLLWSLLVHTTNHFGDWVALSAVCTGAAHVMAATLVGVRAKKLVTGHKAMAPTAVYAWTLLASNLPLPVLPMPIVAITGLFMLIGIFAFDATINRERARYHELDLPVARIEHV
ncbi:MAG: hypothetical protein QM831_46605 [Kofleriaceae bacterium]